MKKSTFFLFLLIAFLGNFWGCDSSNIGEDNNKGNFIAKENIKIFVEEKRTNFINPTSPLVFDKGVYGEYKIIEIAVLFGENTAPVSIDLPKGIGGIIKVKTNSAEIYILPSVAVDIGNQAWNQTYLKGVFNNKNHTCAVNIKFGKK